MAQLKLDALIHYLNTAPEGGVSPPRDEVSVAERLGFVVGSRGDEGIDFGEAMSKSGLSRSSFLQALDELQRLQVVRIEQGDVGKLSLTQAGRSVFKID